MNKQSQTHLNKSSFISLQAELARKKEEISYNPLNVSRNKMKLEIKPHIQERIHLKKKVELKIDKAPDEDSCSVNEGVRDSLLVKSHVYEQLRNEPLLSQNIDSLVVFDFQDSRPTENEEDEEECDADNEWVTFEDSLGRSRTCLREDLPYYKILDSKLKTNEPTVTESKNDETPKMVSEELLLWDQKREELRKMWEEEENRLSQKRDIHYADILFNEARMHGVGFFNFSQDETERQKQQDALKNLREETAKNQELAVALKNRRQEQMKQRIIAARKRKRQQMGLPDLEETELYEDIPETATNKPNSDQEFGKKLEEFLKNAKRSAHIRPWDVGKNGIEAPRVLSQHEWNEKLRAERPSEFAPPTKHRNSVAGNERNRFQKSKKIRPTVIDCEYEAENSSERVSANDTRTKGVEIPPPIKYDRYTKTKISNNHSMAESIEAGLNFLKKKKGELTT